jgi:hypothetical protein
MPPVALTLMAPFPSPKQVIAVGIALMAMAVGWVMVTEKVPTHPFASLAYNVYVPAANPLKALEAW